jgi:hypothetical protein
MKLGALRCGQRRNAAMQSGEDGVDEDQRRQRACQGLAVATAKKAEERLPHGLRSISVAGKQPASRRRVSAARARSERRLRDDRSAHRRRRGEVELSLAGGGRSGAGAEPRQGVDREARLHH